jgi:hypothetical protein
MSNNDTPTSNWATTNARNTARLGYWTGGWLVTMATATFGPMFIWESTSMLTVIAILINIGIGFGMIVANKRHLKGLDELQQKIQLEAMALALGVAVVVGLGFSMLDVSHVGSVRAEISHLVLLIGLTYGAGIAIGRRRYQ